MSMCKCLVFVLCDESAQDWECQALQLLLDLGAQENRISTHPALLWMRGCKPERPTSWLQASRETVFLSLQGRRRSGPLQPHPPGGAAGLGGSVTHQELVTVHRKDCEHLPLPAHWGQRQNSDSSVS